MIVSGGIVTKEKPVFGLVVQGEIGNNGDVIVWWPDFVSQP